MFAYCLNDPIIFTDHTGTVSMANTDDYVAEHDFINGDALGAGENRIAASGYVMFAGMQYSRNSNVRDMFGVLIAWINVDDRNDFTSALNQLNQLDVVQTGKPVAKIISGFKKIRKGIGAALTPLPGPMNEVAAIKLFGFGVSDILIGTFQTIRRLRN